MADPQEAFIEFYQSEYPSAVRLASVLTGSPSLAEDIAQDAFARLYRRFDALEGPPAYLNVTVVNLCREVHRRQRREHQRSARLTPLTGPQPLQANELFEREPSSPSPWPPQLPWRSVPSP